MSQKAAAFLTHLSQNPDENDLFAKDPDAAMKGHDLSEEDRQVLRTKDAEKIREHLGDFAPACCIENQWAPEV